MSTANVSNRTGKSVLVVDDEPALAELLKKFLSATDFASTYAAIPPPHCVFWKQNRRVSISSLAI